MPAEDKAALTGAYVAGRYRLEARLGTGGMGTVYRAFDRSTGSEVAIKQLRSDQTVGRARRAELRFRREYHSLASLEHPRIIEVYDYGVDRAGPYYTMELLDGEDVRELVRLPEPISIERTCSILRDMAAALALLHVRGLVHRDLSPRNVRCTSSGKAKLIDFGVLCEVGVARDIAGTPPYMAPETARGVPVDGRADLFGLGVLGYLLLARRLPYPARSVKELESVWRRTPAPVSRYREGVPPVLDELISALLRIDPLARPVSAAEVIDRLSAAADLAVDESLEVKKGYLASAALVGRRREMETLHQAIERASRGDAAAVFVEALSGTGKTRLLKEASIEAKLQGVVTVSASSETEQAGPYGLMTQVVRSLFAAIPDLALEAGEAYFPRLRRVFPFLPGSDVVEPMGDPAEERMRVQRALTDWIWTVAQARPLGLFIDDIQWADEASAACLASLARKRASGRLLVVTALRTGEDVRAGQAVHALGQAETRVSLRGLDRTEVATLVRSFFGDVANTERLADWMHEVTGGSPLYCSELARSLVDSGIIHYADGVWVLPLDPLSASLPESLAAAMETRIAALSSDASRVAEILAVHGRGLPLQICVELASDLGEDRAFAALNELSQQGVILGSDDAFEFRHDGLREATLRSIEPDRQRTLHRAVGHALLGDEDVGPERAAEIGWHLLEGGEPQRGAVLLERAGREMYDAQALSDCIRPLEAAVRVLRAAGASERRRMELHFMLLAAGWVSNRTVGHRHATEAVNAYRRYTGIALASALRPLLGRRLGLVTGVLVAFARWCLTLGLIGPNPLNVINRFATALAYACGLMNADNRVAELREMIKLGEPMAAFKRRIPYAAYLAMDAFPDILLGYLDRAAAKYTKALDIVRHDRLTPATPAEHNLAEAGMRGLRLLLDVNQFNPRLMEDLSAIDALGLRYYRLVVQTTKVVRHRYRGEERLARKIERSIESTSLQLGSWSTDVQILLFAHPAYSITGDVIGLKRCLGELERRVEEGMRFEDRVAVTRAEYHLLRGERDEADRLLEEFYPKLAEENVLMRQWFLSARAEVALAHLA
ncbi:MAG: AAA family ATPase, partial [Myxococcota bacterium]